MGAWGFGNFENDTALDWIFSNKTKLNEKILFSVLNIIDDETFDLDVESIALVAAEIVAAKLGYASSDFPENINLKKITVNSELINKSLDVIKLITTNSELYSCWVKYNTLIDNEWLNTQNDLIRRLEGH